MNKNNTTLSCEICKGEFCPSHSIAGPCVPVIIKLKEKEELNEK